MQLFNAGKTIPRLFSPTQAMVVQFTPSEGRRAVKRLLVQCHGASSGLWNKSWAGLFQAGWIHLQFRDTGSLSHPSWPHDPEAFQCWAVLCPHVPHSCPAFASVGLRLGSDSHASGKKTIS